MMAAGDGGLKLELDLMPEGNIELGVRALGLRPYLLVEVDVDEQEQVVLKAKIGGFPKDAEVDDLRQFVDLLGTCLAHAPDDEPAV